MIKLYDGGVYLLGGKTLTQNEEEVKALTGKAPRKEEAKKGTMAYSILKAHNQSADMDAMRIREETGLPFKSSATCQAMASPSRSGSGAR